MTQLDTDAQTTAPRLSELSEHERNRLFARVQQRMPAVWDQIRLDHQDESVVIVPSVTIDRTKPGAGSFGQAFEERFLFLLAAAPATAAAHDLRHFDADKAEHR
jgi:hypothetical protein